MVFGNRQHGEPCYVISVAAKIIGLHAQTLRYYERMGLVTPSRSVGRQRLYSPFDIEKLRRIKTLTENLRINAAGAEVALKLMARINEMQEEIDRLTEEVKQLRSGFTEIPSDQFGRII